jgi:hypothetical protein
VFRKEPLMNTNFLLGLLVLASLCLTARAEEVSGTGQASTGMYSNYADDHRSRPMDRDLSSTDPISEDYLLKALVDALNQISKYPRPAELPAIKRVPHAQLEAMICNKSSCGVLASYWHGEGIYIDENLKPETSLFARSVLLHELVHYLQDTNDAWGGLRDCDRWYHRELEAYALQKQFLILIGSPTRVAYSPSGPTCDEPKVEAAREGNVIR